MVSFTPPPRDCDRCPRLHGFLADQRASHPLWHNAPVDPFGPLSARLLIIGLAPGMKGANATGRPFTGDGAGDFLYDMMGRYGFATGTYARSGDDDIALHDVRITNAVRCLPPQNKPTPKEAHNCRPFLVEEIKAMPNLRQILALGRLAHEAVLRCFELRLADYPFAHASDHQIPGFGPNQAQEKPQMRLVSSYHCSRYNTQTGRLTDPMFSQIFKMLSEHQSR